MSNPGHSDKAGSAIARPAVEDSVNGQVIELVCVALASRLQKHGRGAYVGPHETLGVVAEEYDELLEAVRGNEPWAVAAELVDIAVGCIFGVSSLLTTGRLSVREAADLFTHYSERR